MAVETEQEAAIVVTRIEGDDDERVATFKARLIGTENEVAPRSNLTETAKQQSTIFSEANAIDPPLDPLSLVRLVSVSNALRQNVDALVHNVHGGGHTLEPVVDLDSQDARERVRVAMLIEREHEAELDALDALDDGEKPPDPKPIEDPTDDEITERIKALRERARREKVRVENFFANVSSRYSFVRLRRKLGHDEESVGWGAWEVLRNRRGDPSRLNPAQAWTLRALPLDGALVETDCKRRVSDIETRAGKERRRFRRFVQVYEGTKTYFKEYGDPRVMSAASGTFYESADAMKGDEPKAREATELLWFNLDNAESDVYGLVRWSGCVLGAIGSREMEEINLLFFESKAIPPLVVLISGGRLASDAKEELRTIIRDQIKGKKNFHRILILEAEPSNKSAPISGQASQNSVRIEIKPLTDAIFKDQLWGQYDRENRAKIGQSFRVPPILRGETTDFNRATAIAAVRVAEEQVFEPERRDFDFEINRTLLRDLDVTLWRFRSIPPHSENTLDLLETLSKLAEGLISPEEARPVVSRVLGIDLPKVEADWARLPLRLALAGFRPEGEAPNVDPSTGEETSGDGESTEATTEDEPAEVRMSVPQDQFDRLFVDGGDGEAVTP
jgi:PBSX family phage portal protein